MTDEEDERETIANIGAFIRVAIIRCLGRCAENRIDVLPRKSQIATAVIKEVVERWTTVMAANAGTPRILIFDAAWEGIIEGAIVAGVKVARGHVN